MAHSSRRVGASHWPRFHATSLRATPSSTQPPRSGELPVPQYIWHLYCHQPGLHAVVSCLSHSPSGIYIVISLASIQCWVACQISRCTSDFCDSCDYNYHHQPSLHAVVKVLSHSTSGICIIISLASVQQWVACPDLLQYIWLLWLYCHQPGRHATVSCLSHCPRVSLAVMILSSSACPPHSSALPAQICSTSGLKMTSKSAEFETLTCFCLSFRTATWKDFHWNTEHWKQML